MSQKCCLFDKTYKKQIRKSSFSEKSANNDEQNLLGIY